MENKEVFFVILTLAVLFAILSIVSDITITGFSVNQTNNFSLTFSIITIVLVAVLLIIAVIEFFKYKMNK